MLLKISNLNVNINNKKILSNINLSINSGEVHAIMGPNGAGKSTLANAISARNSCYITSGSIRFLSKEISSLSSDQRARLGIFMSFQHPVEIPGVSWNSFIKTSVNATLKDQGKSDIGAVNFLRMMNKRAALLDIDSRLLKRDVNYNFSGGEKKKFEILQMLMLGSKFIILDEIDSGLDVDALQIIIKNINEYRSKDNAVIIITHYNRILDYITPDFVHIISNGTIVKSGNKNLANLIEKQGYVKFE